MLLRRPILFVAGGGSNILQLRSILWHGPFGGIGQIEVEEAGEVTWNIVEAGGNAARNIVEACGNAARNTVEDGGNAVRRTAEDGGNAVRQLDEGPIQTRIDREVT